MKMTADMNEYVNEYVASLKDLVDNSKQQITLLTILAEEYKTIAPDIVRAIEHRIHEVDSASKLSVLYLIDSIIKNLSPKDDIYLRLFSKNIVHTFCSVFQKCDHKVRASMWKLRQTWNEIFQPQKLYELDAEVVKIDPAWPIIRKQEENVKQQTDSNTSKIHINPKIFFAQKAINFEKELLKKQQELNELQRQKSEMLRLERLQKPIFENLQPHMSELEKLQNEKNLQMLPPNVPTDVSLKVEKQKSPFKEKISASNEKKRNAPRLLPADPRLKTVAALQNGGKSSSSAVLQENCQEKLIIIDNNKNRSSSENSLFKISPIRPREAPAPAPCIDVVQSEKDNADLLLKTNESNNKSIDTERCSYRKNKTSNKKTVKSGEQESKISSPSKSSSTTRSSSSSKSKVSSSSSSSSSSRKSKSRSSKSNSSSSSSSSSPRKKSSSSKSRKRSRSPHHHHHHSSSKAAPSEPHLGPNEEKQTVASVVASLPQPQVSPSIADGSKSGKDNVQKKESSRSGSPGNTRKEKKNSQKSTKITEESGINQDEDLRPTIVVAPAPSARTTSGTVSQEAAPLVTKEDLDLRVLPPIPNKRKSDQLQKSNTKKRKEEMIDDLFGKEDVDLRVLAPVHNATLKSPSPPPPGTSLNDKENSIKPKKPEKPDVPRSFSDLRFNRIDRSGRSKPYNRPNSPENDLKDRNRRNIGRDYERNSDRNIEIIMKQAAEQLSQGAITKLQYHNLIQEVLHMKEDQKLRAAQRKDRETKVVYDRNDKGIRSKDHGMHMRPPGPRWPQWHQGWSHQSGPPYQGPPFRPEFRPPMGPWQNHPRMPYGGPMRPDFPHPQFHGGFNPRLSHPPMGPNGPMMMPDRPHNPMNSMNSMSSSNMMGSTSGPGSAAGPKRSNKREVGGSSEDSSMWGSGNNSSISSNKLHEEEKVGESEENIVRVHRDELPEADPKILEEISNDPMRSITIAGVPREIRFYGHNGVIFMGWEDPRDVGFQNGARKIFIDGKDVAVCSFNDDYREFTYEGEVHKIKLGAPTRELFIDDKWYQCYFGGAPITVELGNKKVSIKLDGPAPQVKIGNVKRTDLVLGKINLIINAKIMFPVFLDAKPQVFSIDNKSVILEFMDSLKTVLMNNRPFNVEFGGLPKPITILGKKHYIRFSVLPRPFRAGYVKISGMKGKQPKDTPTNIPVETAEEEEKSAVEQESSQSLVNSSSDIRSPIETDSTSQPGAEQSYLKTNLELDVLSSLVPSGMAPSSGFSYQAESADSAPASDPSDVNQLFQRLVETGLVLMAGSILNSTETKNPEEEEKKDPDIDPVTFEKPETLKTKRPDLTNILFSGMQCSSCGLRFAPELATKYSRHLDWHFRQNRLKKDSSRKLNSRIWFYSINDWIQYEECEDVEDRGQIWFETEKQMETEAAAAEEMFDESAQPTVPTGSEEDGYCLVCREAFSQFYDDEKDEWHYRPAVSFDNKNFHPCCLEDYKRALDESAPSMDLSWEDLKDSVKMEIDPDIKIDELKQEQEKEGLDENIKTEDQDEEETKEIFLESIVSDILPESDEKIIITSEEAERLMEEMELKVAQNNLGESEIKAEPDDIAGSELEAEHESESKIDPESESIEESGIADEASLTDEIEKEAEKLDEDEEEERPTVDSTQVAVKSSIDGNVEHEDAPSAMPVVPAKIKINISIPLNSPKESKDIKEEKDVEEKSDEEEEEKEEIIPEPASIKPELLERNLKILPMVEKDHELSGLCSIM